VTYSATTNIEISNEEKTGSIQIKKTTPGMVNLADLSFILSGTTDTGREISIEAITDEDGIANFENIPIGSYTVSEKGSSVPYAYLTADPEEVTVDYSTTTSIDISNAEKTGTLQVTKSTLKMKDIANITFILSGKSDSGREISIEAVTDENGIAVFVGIPVGTYTITEKGSSVPYGYMTADSQNATVTFANDTNVQFYNFSFDELIPQANPKTDGLNSIKFDLCLFLVSVSLLATIWCVRKKETD